MLAPPPTPDAIADSLWPKAVKSCGHEVKPPLMCADHLNDGLLCERCLVMHIATTHRRIADNVPWQCTACHQRLNSSVIHTANIVALNRGVLTMRTARDVTVVMRTTSPIALQGQDRRSGVYDGHIRLWGSQWLCEHCRNSTPLGLVIDFDIGPPSTNQVGP